MRDLLPATIVDRPKSGMRVPVQQWLSGPLRELAGLPQSHSGLLPFVKILQSEGTGVQGRRAQIVVAGIVAHDTQRLVDVVKRGGMVAPDGTGQP